jgi:hypothetical protein
MYLLTLIILSRIILSLHYKLKPSAEDKIVKKCKQREQLRNLDSTITLLKNLHFMIHIFMIHIVQEIKPLFSAQNLVPFLVLASFKIYDFSFLCF